MGLRSYPARTTRRSKFGVRCEPQLPAQLPLLTSPLLNTAGAESLAMIAEKQNAHSRCVTSVQFSPNGALIVSGSWDQTIKVWKSGAIWLKITSLGPKLTRPAFLGRHTRAGEREGQRPQRLGHVCPVLAKWIANCLRIARQDDQSLGFGCVLGLESPLLGQN